MARRRKYVADQVTAEEESKIVISIETVTPDKARQYLSEMTSNRKLKKKLVDTYVDIMTRELGF